jgi:hypothetical protein
MLEEAEFRTKNYKHTFLTPIVRKYQVHTIINVLDFYKFEPLAKT